MKLLTLPLLGNLFKMEAVRDFSKIGRLRFTPTPAIRVIRIEDGRGGGGRSACRRRGGRRLFCRRIRENKLYLVMSVVGVCGWEPGGLF